MQYQHSGRCRSGILPVLLRLNTGVYLRLQKELVERDAAVRLGDSKLLERIRTLEVEVADNDEYSDELEQQLEQLGTEKESLQTLYGELQVRPLPPRSESWLLDEVPERRKLSEAVRVLAGPPCSHCMGNLKDT